jgi:hypothetical protein
MVSRYGIVVVIHTDKEPSRRWRCEPERTGGTSLIRPERYNFFAGQCIVCHNPDVQDWKFGNNLQVRMNSVVLSLSGFNLARLASNILNSALNQSERNPLLFEPHLFAKSVVDEGIE